MSGGSVALRDGAEALLPTVELPEHRPAPPLPDQKLLRLIEEAQQEWTPPPGIPSRRMRRLLVANVAAAVVYIGWWLIPGHVGSPALFAMLAFTELFMLLHVAGLWWTLWTTDKRPLPARAPPVTVDALITTCGEPMEVVERTLRAVLAMRGTHSTVVLDDASRDEMRDLARRLGAGYVARVGNEGAKAGNLNFALALTRGDVVVAFDADHRPSEDFLERTLPYFSDPGLAVVQTPQFYADVHDRAIARDAYLQQTIFYGPILRGKSGVNAAFCCGTGFAARREALEEIGGFDERSIVEDMVTTMRLHRRGWRSAYYPYVVTEGLGPPDLRSYFRQQFRWARGSLGAVADAIPLRRGFTPAQRIQYLLGTTYYLTGFATLVYLSLPVLYIIGGWSAFAPGSGSFILCFVPYMLLALITVRTALGDEWRVEHLRYAYGAFPVYVAAALAAVLRLPARFRVTGLERRRSGVPALAWVTVAAFMVTAVALVAALVVRPPDSRTFTMVTWSAVNLVLLSGIVAAVIREVRPGVLARLQGIRDRAAGARLPALGERPSAIGGLPELVIRRKPERLAATQIRRPGRQLLWIMGIALALRIALVPVQGIRLDEATTWSQARQSLPDLWHTLATGDVHPPLFHTSLHVVMQVFGDSLWAMRALSIVVGTATVGLLYLLAIRLVSRRAALCAAALGAVCPIWVWHSGEARAYPLLLALELGSTLLLMNALERGRAWRWCAYTVVTAAAFYTHYLAALLPLVHLLYVAFVPRGERRKPVQFALAWAGVAVLVAPWVIFVVSQGSGTVRNLTNGIVMSQDASGPIQIFSTLMVFSGAFLIGYQQNPPLEVVASIAIGLWPVIPIALIMTRRLPAWLRQRSSLLLLSWMVVPVVALFVVGQWKPEVWLQRYAMIATPALLIVLGVACARVMRANRLLLIAPLALFGAVAVFNQFQPDNPMREDFRGATDVMRSTLGPADGIIVGPQFVDSPVRYYLDRPIEGVQAPRDGVPAADTPGLLPALRAHAGHSVWYLTLYPSVFDPHRAVPHYLDTHLRALERKSFGQNLQMTRYAVPAGFSGAASPTAQRLRAARPPSSGTQPAKPRKR